MANEQPVSQGRPAPFGQLHCASYAVPGPDNGRPAPFALFTSEECSSLSAPCDTTSLSAQRDLASLPAPCDGTGLPAQRDLSHAQHRVRDGATSSSVNIRNNSNWLIRDAHVPACDLCHLIQQLYCERAILWKWLYESVACDEQTEDHPAASSELVNGWPHHNNSPQSHSSSSAETVVVPDAWPCPASEPPPPVPAGVAGPPCPFPWAVVPPCQRLQQIDRELSKLRQLHYLTERDKAMKSVSSGSSSASAVGTATVRPRRPTEEFNGHAAPPLPHHAVPALSEGSVLLLQRESFMELLSKLPASIDLLLTLSTSPENCLALTHFSAIPVVVELIHDAGQGFSAAGGREVRDKAERVLNQLVISQIEDKRCRREVFVLRMLEKLRQYSSRVLYQPQSLTKDEEDLPDAFPVPALSALCEKTFEADYRHTFSYLGGVQAVAEVLTVNFERYDHTTSRYHANIRKYACLILTNVTCGDGIKKAVLCTSRRFLDVLALLLTGGPEDLRGKTAAVVRNLSWKADVHSQEKLREAKIVPALLRALMKAEQAENHLVSMLCALNNLSAHCDENKNDMCAYEGALARLVGLLKHKPATDKLDVPENAGSVLYRLSKIIAHREDYRQILRDHQCLDILVEHLRSPHLGWVSNAVRIIWVLSSRSLEDQQHLWDVGAVTLLQTLSTSKYPAIAEGSGRAFRHLMAAVRGEGGRTRSLQSHASVPSSPLVARQERGHPANRSLRDFHRFRRPDVPPPQQQQPRPMMNLVDNIARQVAGGETQPSPPTSPVAPAHPATLYDADEPSDLDVPGTCDEFVDFTRKQPRQLDDYSAPETVTRFSTERTPKPRPGTAGTPLRSVLHTTAISTVGSRGSSPDSGPDVPTPAIRGGEDATEYNSCVASGTMSPNNLMTEMERDAFFDEIPPSPSLMNRSPRARTGRRRMLPTPPVERPGGRAEAGFKEDGVEEKPVVYKDEGLSKATSLSSIVSSCLVATHPPPKPPAPAAGAPHPPLPNDLHPAAPRPLRRRPEPSPPVAEKKEEEERKPAQFNVLEGFAELKKKVAERKAIVDAESSPLVNGERCSPEAEKNGKIVEKDKETGGFNVASSFALLMNSVNEKKAKAETPGKVEEPVVVVEKKPEEEENPIKETTEKVEDEGYSEVSPKTEEKLKENGQKEEKADGKKKVKEKSPSVEKKPLEPIAETAELPREVSVVPEPRPEPTASTSTVVEDDNKLLADCIYAAMPVRKPVHPVKTDKKRRPKPPNPRLAAAGKTSSRHRRIEDAMKRTASEGGAGSPAGHPPGSGSPAGHLRGPGAPPETLRPVRAGCCGPNPSGIAPGCGWN
ncbi:uncharacterized protein LOC129584761 [Paramacrobiotus metropolitanus]|uniref:uncharacterized protein LOC129584761 n=1 Tax=Paramacrobiotus metropolitanus TaxID=2943436 RepID=UPI002445A251|nr:uncharacterized protein LOC129584761 [Paramacrobiotus metropolitanus]